MQVSPPFQQILDSNMQYNLASDVFLFNSAGIIVRKFYFFRLFKLLNKYI